MNTSGEIPAALIIEAKKYGVYNLSCIGQYDNVSVYIQKREEHPSRPIYPTGLPTLFLWNGTEARCVCGMESFDILDKLERRTIPTAVEKAARGCKHLGGTLEKVARYNDKDVYTFTYTEPMSTGTLELYLWNGSMAEIIGGVEALRILNSEGIKMYTDVTKDGAGLFDLRIIACYYETTRGTSIYNALKKYHLTSREYINNKRRVLNSINV